MLAFQWMVEYSNQSISFPFLGRIFHTIFYFLKLISFTLSRHIDLLNIFISVHFVEKSHGFLVNYVLGEAPNPLLPCIRKPLLNIHLENWHVYYPDVDSPSKPCGKLHLLHPERPHLPATKISLITLVNLLHWRKYSRVQNCKALEKNQKDYMNLASFEIIFLYLISVLLYICIYKMMINMPIFSIQKMVSCFFFLIV